MCEVCTPGNQEVEGSPGVYLVVYDDPGEVGLEQQVQDMVGTGTLLCNHI